MDTLGWMAAAIGALVAVVAGGIYLFGRLRALFQGVEKLAALVTHELTNNSGKSMKDNVEAAAEDLHGIAVAVGMLQRAVAENAARLDRLEGKHKR